jgi:hypothetical protein
MSALPAKNPAAALRRGAGIRNNFNRDTGKKKLSSAGRSACFFLSSPSEAAKAETPILRAGFSTKTLGKTGEFSAIPMLVAVASTGPTLSHSR